MFIEMRISDAPIGAAIILVAVLSTWFAASPPASAAQYFKWTDERGRIHYSDKPPPDVVADELDIKVKSHVGPVTVSTFSASLETNDAVIMYGAEWCGICKRAKKYMDSEGIPYKEYDVDKSSKGKRDYKKLNGKGVPIILVGDQRMNGFSPKRLRAMLEAARSD